MADDRADAVADRRAVPPPRPRRPGAAPRRSPPTTPARSTIGGTVVDGAGAPVPDAVVETWQCGGPFARCATGADGDVGGAHAPPAGRGRRSTARRRRRTSSCRCSPAACSTASSRASYFDGEPGQRRRPGARRSPATGAATLLVAGPTGPATYRFDIRLQGDDESVFFAL